MTIGDDLTQSTVTDARWWLPEYEARRYENVLSVVRRIRSRQVQWRRRDLLHACLYRNLALLGFGPHQYGMLDDENASRLTMNLVKAKIDTYVSLICRSKPKPMFLTSGGEWSMKRKAKGLERWCEGKFYELELYDEVFPLCVLDTGIFDYGVAKVSISDEEDEERADVLVERAFPWEMVIDDMEAQGGAPRNMYQRKWIDRGVLEGMFSSQRSEIRDAPRELDADEVGRDDTSDQVLVTEAWHLPSSPGAEDGRRVLALGNVTLLDEAYEEDHFPFAFLHRMPPPHGMRGTPIAHELRPIQIALNQAFIDMQDSLSMFARPHWMSPRSAHVERAHLDDDIGTIIEFDGPNAPQAYVPAAVSPELVAYVQNLWSKADDVIGISSMRSSGVVPSNLKSGKAIELHNDVQDGRFLVASQRYENWVTKGVTTRMICAARRIAEKNPKYAARYTHKTYVQMVAFKDVDMKADEYVMKVYPASALASTPSAKLDQLQDMFDRGVIDMPTFRHLLDFPDLESAMNRETSGQELAEKLLERYLEADDAEDESVYLAPEPTWPHDEMLGIFVKGTTAAQLENAPDANVELCRRFITQLQAAIAAKNAPPPGAPQALAAGGPGPGVPPPGGPPAGGGLPPAPAGATLQ